MVKTLSLRRPVIAVTGSAGKSTTKEMIASILQRRWKIFKTLENWNSYKYTAKYAKKINSSHKAVVLEYGMIRKGNIKRHCELIKPNIGIVTNVGTAHIGNFDGDIQKVASAKSELIQNMKSSGLLILNADDANSSYLNKKRFNGKILTIGINHQADYQAHNIEYKEKGMSFQVKLNGVNQTFYVPIYGQHNIYNALFAIAISRHLRFSLQEIRVGLRSYRKLGRRLAIYRLDNGIRLIDDTFSANPQAMKAAINVLTRIGKKTNIAVLGSMLQMGDYSIRGHREVGRYLANRNIHYLYVYGKDAKGIGQGAVNAGFPSSQVFHVVVRDTLHRHLLKKIKPGSTILVKGSHGLKMNKTVQFLRKSV